MGFLSLLKSLPQPKQTAQKAFARSPMPSTTMDEQTLVVLIKEALALSEGAKTAQEIEATEFELLSLKKQLDLRETEQVLHYQRLKLPKAQVLEYQAAMHLCRTQLEQALLDLRHKDFML